MHFSIFNTIGVVLKDFIFLILQFMYLQKVRNITKIPSFHLINTIINN